MSIRRLDKISLDVSNIIVFSKSASVDLFVRTKLRERFEVTMGHTIDVNTDRELKNAKLTALTSPIMSPYWLIHVNADKITKADLLKSLAQIPAGGKTVYWTADYGTFMRLTQNDDIKEQGMFAPSFSFSRLTEVDISDLHKALVHEKRRLPSKLLLYVMKNYRYEPQAVMSLFRYLESGNRIESQKDIVSLIGLPGNSVASLALSLLRTEPKSEKTARTSFNKVVRQLSDLSETYDYSKIRNFLLSNIDGFMDMKQLQIMGKHRAGKFIVPEEFDEKRLKRLKRFEKIILETIPMVRLVNLKLALTSKRTFDPESDLLYGIAVYYNSLVPITEGDG